MLRDLYRIDHLPIFQNRMYETPEEAIGCPHGNIRLVQDTETGLIFNVDFNPELMVYDENYQNEQALSQNFRKHLERVKDIIGRVMGHDRLVEIGCGKGYFLESLSDSGFGVIGFDPAYEGNNPKVYKKYFESNDGICANGIILRHVLEHIKDPLSFLEKVRDANYGSGMVYIEVPCFDWICRHFAWFDIFYEHVNYFRLKDLQNIFGSIIESGWTFGGQYLYVVADLASLRVPKCQNNDLINLPIDFFVNIEKIRSDGKSAVWGGASKGVIFSLLMQRIGMPVDVVIDINPAKQGKYLPGTGLKVMSPQEGLSWLPPGATIFVMNSNYLEEIIEMSSNAYQYVSIDHV